MEEIMGSLEWIGKVIAAPINLFTWIVTKIRTRRYDPEKVPCPGCGFRGDSGTAGKSCRVTCIDITGAERKALLHTCFRCSAQFSTRVLTPASKWIVNKPASEELTTQQKQMLVRP